MRIRSIKPEFWRSDDVAALPLEDRLLFVGLWSYVDDSGIGVDKVAHICADLFAPDLEVDPPEVFGRVTGGLRNLADRGLILRYEVEGKRYLYITNWSKHQRIDKPSKRRFPLPDQGVCSTTGGLQEDSGSVPENVAPGTGEQGNRGTGEQGERHAVAVAPAPTPKRGSRLPENWMPRQDIVEKMQQECPGVNLEAEHRKFLDHWHSVAGAKGTKVDWNKTWCNWIRRAGEWSTAKPAPAQRMSDTASLGARLQAQYDQKELL